jgi:hypothetical protein
MRAVLRLIVLMTVPLVWASPTLLAQTSDLSGTWLFDEARSDATAVAENARLVRGGRGGAPAGMVITQSADELTVQRGNQSFTYKLDGSESFGPPGGETKSTVAWDKGALVVTWKREFFAGNTLGYQTSTGRDVYTLTGGTLTVERRVTNARGTGGTQASQAVYNKS